MATFFLVLAGVFALATLATLFRGLFAMGESGPDARQRSNRMMQYRVLLQGGAIVCFVLWYLARG